MSREKDKGRAPPFVMMFRHTLKSAAWKVTSVGARALFVALQANHNTNSQNAVFMSARRGAKELGVNKDTVGKWLHELEHYGFIVKVRGHHLGVDGCGKAALYRLTDRWHASEPPTYDFEKWPGELFEEGKQTRDKKQNPVRKTRTPRPKNPDIRANPIRGLNGQKCPVVSDISEAGDCPLEPDVTSFTRSLESSNAKWCVPIPNINPCDEADNPAWVAAWLEQIPAPTVSLAEIREALGYRQ
jgi:hypothetical protein